MGIIAVYLSGFCPSESGGNTFFLACLPIRLYQFILNFGVPMKGMSEFLDMLLYNEQGDCIARAKSRGLMLAAPEFILKEFDDAPQVDKRILGPIYYGIEFKVLGGEELKVGRFSNTMEQNVNYFGKYVSMAVKGDMPTILIGLYMHEVGAPEPNIKLAIKALEKHAKEVKKKNADHLDRVLAAGCRAPYDMEMLVGSLKFN